MAEKEASDLALQEHDRARYFRVDKAKGNYSPAVKAMWRQFINVELPNGDDVGVVAPWNYPGQGEATPERQEQERASDFVFLQLVDRFTLEGRIVSERSGRNYAPALFAEEAEAKVAKLNRVTLKASMLRLFKIGKIKAVDEVLRWKSPAQNRSSLTWWEIGGGTVGDHGGRSVGERWETRWEIIPRTPLCDLPPPTPKAGLASAALGGAAGCSPSPAGQTRPRGSMSVSRGNGEMQMSKDTGKLTATVASTFTAAAAIIMSWLSTMAAASSSVTASSTMNKQPRLPSS
jgi:hypothetical protein